MGEGLQSNLGHLNVVDILLLEPFICFIIGVSLYYI